MYETLTGQNAFVLQSDPERLAAHRREIKFALAEITVKKSRIEELRNIVRKLSDDSERAAAKHSVAAGRLQAELDELDQRHISTILAGTPTPPKDIERRQAILAELTRLNQTLETTCEASRRAAKPIEKQIQSLVMETTSEAVLESQLRSLCSVGLRRRQMLMGHKLQGAQAGLSEAIRVEKVLRYNVQICELNRDAREGAIVGVKLADTTAVVEALQQEIRDLQAASGALQQEALAE